MKKSKTQVSDSKRGFLKVVNLNSKASSIQEQCNNCDFKNHSGFDVYFLSTAPWDNPDAWTHKRLWVAKYFDEKLIRKRLILCHHKQLMIGDYLIDDRRFNGASEFKGDWIHYGSENFPNWKSVLNYLGL